MNKFVSESFWTHESRIYLSLSGNVDLETAGKIDEIQRTIRERLHETQGMCNGLDIDISNVTMESDAPKNAINLILRTLEFSLAKDLYIQWQSSNEYADLIWVISRIGDNFTVANTALKTARRV